MKQKKEVSIYGTWVSQYNDGYTITESSVVYDDGGYGYGWEGKIEEVSDPYIYVSINNKYYAVYYSGLKEKDCKFSNAYKAGGKTRTDTLAEAKSEFTVDNGYYATLGEYKRK